MEQHGGTVWHNVAQCGGTVEHCGETVLNSETQWWNSVEWYGVTV